MVNAYEKIPFFTSENDIIILTVAYKVLRPVESSIFRLVFTFKIVSTKIEVTSTKDWFKALETSILEPLVDLFGKNVKILSLQISNQTKNESYKLPFTQVYGRAEGNSEPKNVLVFELLAEASVQPLRFNVRAPANLYTKLPIPAENLPKVFAFESLFVNSVSLFSDKLQLEYDHKSKKSIIAANLKSTTVKKSKKLEKTPQKPRKPRKRVIRKK